MSTHYKGTPEVELALDTYIKLSRATNSLDARLTGRANIEHLTISQFGVLEALLHLGPMCQNSLGSKLLKSGGNMTLVIDNLEKRGLVRRERNRLDRREVNVNLTPQGREMIEYIFPKRAADITAEMSVLTAEEQKTLGYLCRKLGKRSP